MSIAERNGSDLSNFREAGSDSWTISLDAQIDWNIENAEGDAFTHSKIG
ncbi:MAG: hypothetical protein WAT85_01485 [Trichococcus flocculiformis]|jgi:hypothetical protein|nr:hypothetical protein [Trichococcus sp.]